MNAGTVAVQGDSDDPRTGSRLWRPSVAAQHGVEPAEVINETPGSIGLGFQSLPPGPLIINKVAPKSWAEDQGFRLGDEVTAVNGVSCSELTAAGLKEAMSKRPLALKLKGVPPPEAEKPALNEANVGISGSVPHAGEDRLWRPSVAASRGMEPAEIVNQTPGTIGLGFDHMAPEPMVVNKVTPGTWAAEQGFKIGDEVIELNGVQTADLNVAKVKDAMKNRPVAMKLKAMGREKVDPATDAQEGPSRPQATKEEQIAAASKIAAPERSSVAKREVDKQPQVEEKHTAQDNAVATTASASEAASEATKQQVEAPAGIADIAKGRSEAPEAKADQPALDAAAPAANDESLRAKVDARATAATAATAVPPSSQEDASALWRPSIAALSGVEPVEIINRTPGAIGLGFDAMPPGPSLKVNKISPNTWAAAQGFKLGDQVIEVCGVRTSDLTATKLKSLMSARPVSLRLKNKGLEGAAAEGEKKVGAQTDTCVPQMQKVESRLWRPSFAAQVGANIEEIVSYDKGGLGLSFQHMAPNPMVVNKVTPGTWAAQTGFKVGDEVVEINGVSVSEYNLPKVKEVFAARPVAFKLGEKSAKENIANENISNTEANQIEQAKQPLKVATGAFEEQPRANEDVMANQAVALQNVRVELQRLRLLAVKKIARKEGIAERLLEEADEKENPKAAVIGLLEEQFAKNPLRINVTIVRADCLEESVDEERRRDVLKSEMQSLKMSEVKKRAREEGVTQDEIDEAEDTDNPKEMLIATAIRKFMGGGVSDGSTFCVCRVVGKPAVKDISTKGAERGKAPVWNHSTEVDACMLGDSLEFSLMRNEFNLGTVEIPSEMFFPGGFEGRLLLRQHGAETKTGLTIKIEDSNAIPEVQEIGKRRSEEYRKSSQTRDRADTSRFGRSQRGPDQYPKFFKYPTNAGETQTETPVDPEVSSPRSTSPRSVQGKSDGIGPPIVQKIRQRFKAAVYAGPSGMNFEKIFAGTHKDQHAAVNLEDFSTVLRKNVKVPPDDLSDKELKAFFQWMDYTGEGSISLSELVAFVGVEEKVATPNLTAAHMSKAVESKRRAGELDPELANAVRAKIKAGAYSRSNGGSSYDALFRKLARHDSKNFSLEELKGIMRKYFKITPTEISDKEIKLFFQWLDFDGEGVIGVDSLVAFINNQALVMRATTKPSEDEQALSVGSAMVLRSFDSNKFLSVRGQSLEDRASVVQSFDNSMRGSQWNLKPVSKDGYDDVCAVQNANSGKYLSVAVDSKVGDVWLVQSDEAEDDHSLWIVKRGRDDEEVYILQSLFAVISQQASNVGFGALRSGASSPTPRHHAHLSGAQKFRQVLLRREPSFACAWRRILDVDWQMRLTHKEFCEACRRYNVMPGESIKQVWEELDSDQSGTVSLSELDWETSETLGTFYQALVAKFGTVQEAMKRFGISRGHKLRKNEFMKVIRDEKLGSRPEAEALFSMLNNGSDQSRPAVTAEELYWLDAAASEFELPIATRTKPGSLAGFDDNQEQAVREGIDYLDNDHGWADWEPECSNDELDEPRYEKLHREAMERNGRFEEWIESQKSPMSTGKSPLPKAHLQQRFDSLYDDHKTRSAKHMDKTKQHFANTFPVLAQRRRNAGKYDRERLNSLSKHREHRHPRCSSTPSLHSKENDQSWHEKTREERNEYLISRSEKLYEHAAISQKRRELAAQVREEAAKQAADERRKFHTEKTEQVFERNFREEERRTAWRNQILKQKAERENFTWSKMKNSRHKGRARPETFFRLYLDGLDRLSYREEKKRAAEFAEEYHLRSRSVHAHLYRNDGTVFTRLHTNYGRSANAAVLFDFENDDIKDLSPDVPFLFADFDDPPTPEPEKLQESESDAGRRMGRGSERGTPRGSMMTGATTARKSRGGPVSRGTLMLDDGGDGGEGDVDDFPKPVPETPPEPVFGKGKGKGRAGRLRGSIMSGADCAGNAVRRGTLMSGGGGDGANGDFDDIPTPVPEQPPDPEPLFRKSKANGGAGRLRGSTMAGADCAEGRGNASPRGTLRGSCGGDGGNGGSRSRSRGGTPRGTMAAA